MRDKIGGSPHLWRAIRFGAVVTVVSVAVCAGLIALAWLFLPGVLPRSLDGNVDTPSATSLVLAFAQVFTGFLAVLVAGVLGYLAIQEFREGQQRPRFRLIFQSSGNERFSMTLTPSYTHYLFQIAIVNDGPVIGVWYAVQLRVSFVPMDHHRPLDPNGPIQPVAGQMDHNWRQASIADLGSWLFTFLSNGQWAAYPQFPLVLLQFAVPTEWLEAKSYTLEYDIASEHCAPIQGALQLEVLHAPS